MKNPKVTTMDTTGAPQAMEAAALHEAEQCPRRAPWVFARDCRIVSTRLAAGSHPPRSALVALLHRDLRQLTPKIGGGGRVC